MPPEQLQEDCLGLLEELSKPDSGGCGYALALSQLEPTERAAVETAVDNQEWAPVALSRKLAEHRIVVSQQSISRHRRGECVQCH